VGHPLSGSLDNQQRLPWQLRRLGEEFLWLYIRQRTRTLFFPKSGRNRKKIRRQRVQTTLSGPQGFTGGRVGKSRKPQCQVSHDKQPKHLESQHPRRHLSRTLGMKLPRLQRTEILAAQQKENNRQAKRHHKPPSAAPSSRLSALHPRHQKVSTRQQVPMSSQGAETPRCQRSRLPPWCHGRR